MFRSVEERDTPPQQAMVALSTVLVRERTRILAEWAARARGEKVAASLSHEQLIDNAPAMLDRIAVLADRWQAIQPVDMSPPEAEVHAQQRIEVGYELAAVITEYAFFREAVLDAIARQTEEVEKHELRVFHRMLDQCVRVTAERYAATRLRILAALDRLASETLGEDTVDALLQKLVSIFVSASSADIAAVFLLDGGSLVLRASAGIEDDPAAPLRLAPGEGFAGRIAAMRSPVAITGDAIDGALRTVPAGGRKVRALYGVPFEIDGELIGVAYMGSCGSEELSVEDRSLFRTLSNRAAALLVHAHLRESADIERQRFALALRLAMVSVFEQDADLRYTAAFISGVDLRPEEVIGKTEAEVFQPGDADVLAQAKRAVLETGVAEVKEVKLATLGGRHYRLAIEPSHRLRHGTGVICAAIDDTLRKTEEAYEHRMIGILGHDLRNPIHAITGTARMLLDRDLADPERKAALRIQRSADRMNALVSDLLDLTRARTGGIPVERQHVDLDELAADALDEVAVAHPDRKLRLEARSRCIGRWDPERLKQVLSNLLGNAIRYGSSDAPVVLRVACERDQARLEVHNQGTPIPREDVETLFEPYRRGSSHGGGLGLGLFIAREIVIAHGGTIEVASSADQGTTFVVRIPVEAA
jgi:signal transduction histidine kinase